MPTETKANKQGSEAPADKRTADKVCVTPTGNEAKAQIRAAASENPEEYFENWRDSAIRDRNDWLELGLSETQIEQLARSGSTKPPSLASQGTTRAKASGSEPPVQASTYTPPSNSAWTAVNTKPEKSLGRNMEDVQTEDTLPSTTQ